MPPRPRLSLCIPTWNRAACLQGALESGLREMAGLEPGTVELLVSDNGSTDDTPQIIARLQAQHPQLRAFRNAESLGFDRNYLRCVEEAHGEFVWVMGDDDVWLPGSLQRMLAELEDGADACLCLAEACDPGLNPIVVLPWYLDPEPPEVWLLENREDLLGYFNACARNAGVFAFISVAVFRRDRFLQNREVLDRGLGSEYIHVWGMLAYLRQSLRLHYIPEVLIQNRLSDARADSWATVNLYGRWMKDLRAWTQVADAVLGDDPGLCDAFCRILGRNHHNTILPGLRKCAPTEPDWLAAVPYLVRAGFPPVQVAAVDFAFKHLAGDRLPMPTLDPASLCLADLPLVARGARHVAVLALGGLQNLFDGAGLLAALRSQGGPHRVRVFCRPECAELLDGFEVQTLDPARYGSDEAYRASIAQTMADLSPELVVNLDPERGIASDDLVAMAQPAGAIAFALPDRGQDATLIQALNGGYTRLIPREAGPAALLEALGLEQGSSALWPSQAVQEEAQAVLVGLGWDPARTLAVLVDHASVATDPAFQRGLGEAAREGWNLVGMGGRGTYQILEDLLSPWEGRAVNLAGGVGLGSMAALLQLFPGFLGGTALLQSMARACACPPYAPKDIEA